MGIKLNVLKGVAGFGAAVGTGVIIDNLARATTPVGANKIHRIFVRVGAFGLGGYLGEKAADYTTQTIDDVAAVFGVGKKLKKEFEESITIINNAVKDETVQTATETSPTENK